MKEPLFFNDCYEYPSTNSYMNSKLLKLRRTVPKPSPTSSSILPSSLIPNLYQFARSAQFISLVFLKITIAPENKAVTLPPETGKKSLSPARSPRPGRLPRKGRVSPVRRLKRASSMVRGMVHLPLPAHRQGEGDKATVPSPFRHRRKKPSRLTAAMEALRSPH